MSIFKKDHKKYPVDVSKLWLECAKRDLINDPLIRTSLDQLFINPQDKDCLDIITQQIQAEDRNELLNPEPFRKTNPNNITGAIRLGKVLHTGAIWGISPRCLTTHLLVVGITGGGKTSVIKQILRQILERK